MVSTADLLETESESGTVAAQAERAGAAARILANVTRAQKDAGLQAMADALAAAEPQVLAANAVDLAKAEAAGTSVALLDRLRLTPARVAGMVTGLRDLAGLPDPVGDVVRGWTNANGVQVRQVRVPFGVVGIIYEARPNVTADAGGICLKSGNAALLRGSSSAAESNLAIVAALRGGLGAADLPADAVQLVPGPREVTTELMAARGLVDVLIPRGGAGLIEHVVRNSQVPVIETGVGNCHLYVDETADQEMALAILINAKTQRPSVCNAVETLLVHSAAATTFVPKALSALAAAGVTVHGDEQIGSYAEQLRTRAETSPRSDRRADGTPVDGSPADGTPVDGSPADGTPVVLPATDADFAGEYLSLDLAVAVVADLDAALAHIRRYSTGHSETIITESQSAAQRFSAEVDAAAVLINASSRFVDGGEFGFGAEIGISTQKLHARGPMGLLEMTSTKYIVVGSGQVR